MVKLPALKSKDVAKKLIKLGFQISRQTGSHARLIHPDGRATTVALHNRDLPKGTLKGILRQSEISLAEFLKK
ncbi:MAG: type II toxin-antitoxin system HicA family toxin [Patescibacteria group bacterium]|nr:type II toxin-antitoxin system HicA family toxin [Patescibacteria group bacterium]